MNRATLVAQMVKNLPAIQEIWVQSPGWEDPLEKELAPHSSILAWRILWTEEPGRVQSMGSQRGGHNWATNTFSPSNMMNSVDLNFGLHHDSSSPHFPLPFWNLPLPPLSSPQPDTSLSVLLAPTLSLLASSLPHPLFYYVQILYLKVWGSDSQT